MTSSEANLPTLAKMLFAARKKASRDGPIGVRVVWRMPIICIDHKLCTWSSVIMLHWQPFNYVEHVTVIILHSWS